MVANNEVDFAIDSFGVTDERLTVGDYLIFSNGGYERLYIKNPKDGFDWTVYTKSFTVEAWIYFFLFCFGLPFLLWIPMFDCKYSIRICCTYINSQSENCKPKVFST